MSTRKKILVVDDEIINLDFFEVMLSKLGFVVEKAGNGEEGLAMVKKFFPDLIILDNIMPKMSGWELTKILKADPKYKEIPIIMLSALDDVKDKVEGFEMGVDDYITKPFNFSEVLARIRAVLRNRELFSQLVAREFRLSLAEELSSDIKTNVFEFIRTMDDLDETIGKINAQGLTQEELAALLVELTKKTQRVRKNIAGLDARIERTMVEWENLKKNEIGLNILEKQIRRSLQQEQV
ncbi:MAG: response regulator [Spirochaetaceae bacterium]|jgi:DNA-binding response OmpR family regulator|nr:response regulator [Spirochaetaceae bacterium]